ncbi:MAG: ATP-binding protein [Acidimicrobiia bacterium]|nr:ATP-binding protein [Acidimicrobiia bacterium]
MSDALSSRRNGFRSIGTKILLRTVVVALLPLVVLSTVVFIGLNSLGETATEQIDESRELLSRESVAVNAEEQAVSVAREINATLLERVADVTDWARNPTIVDAAAVAGEYSREQGLVGTPIDDLEEQFNIRRSTRVAGTAEAFLKDELTYKDEFGEVFFTDANGFNAALTARTSDFVQSDEEWWQEAWADGISVSDVEFDDSAGVFSVDISVRIDDPETGARLGVMKAVLSVSFVQSIATARSLSTTDYTVALPDGRLIAETATFHSPDRMMAELDPGDATPGLVQAIEEGGAGALITEETVTGYTRTSEANFLGSQVLGFKGFDWIVLSDQRALVAFSPLRGLNGVTEQIESSRTGLQGTVVVAGLLGLVAAAVMSRLLSRGIVGPIQRLTSAASDAAITGLPAAVGQIEQEGSDLDAIEIPELELSTGDELEQLASSFNSVQGTAIRLATEQAVNRRNTADMFVNLGRRNNSLLKRQLRFIDSLERNEADPETLESLFKLDHLATRMRRNAESLLVLAGERSPRRWSAPVNIRDAVQAALAEVEEYERADMSQVAEGTLQGNVVADVAHILAELIENALNFSPPQTTVVVHGRTTAEGYTVTVTDEGLGMDLADLDAANERLATTYDLSQVPAQHIGLYVVGRLARQHDIAISLGQAPAGGTTATVELPAAITTETAATEDQDAAGAVDPESIDDAEAAALAMLKEAEEKLAEIAEAKHRAQDATSDDIESGATQIVDSGPGDGTAGVEAARSETDSAPVEETPDNEREQPAVVDRDEADTVTRRADDDVESHEADARRGPDDAPKESVQVDGIDIPRRQSGLAARLPAPAPRVEKPAQADPEAVNEVVDEPDDLAEFGFTRRQAGEAPDAAPKPEVAMVPKASPSDADGDVEASARENRSQWSSFQQGKEAAESTPSEDS